MTPLTEDFVEPVSINFPAQTTIVPTTEDISISFLPLAHMFERVVQVRSGPVEDNAEVVPHY